MYDAADLVPQVIEVITHAMPNNTVVLTETTYLPGLREFDSLVIANVLEALETTLGIEAEPKLLLPEAFENPRTIADLFVRSWASRQEIQMETEDSH